MILSITRNLLPFNKDGNKGNQMILLVLNTSRSCFSHDSNVNEDVGELKSPCKINVDREDQPTNKLMQMIKDKQQYVLTQSSQTLN